jgi:hypothetical protein
VAECLEAHYGALNELRFVVIGAYVTDPSSRLSTGG